MRTQELRGEKMLHFMMRKSNADTMVEIIYLRGAVR